MLNDIVVPHDPGWKVLFAVESDLVATALKLDAVYHIGSTSIPGIYAKPIIDMLGEAVSLDEVDESAPRLEEFGYQAMGEFGIAGRRYFRKDVGGVRKFHLHIFERDSEQALRHLRFRDFLRAHPDWAKKYSDLKRRLASECGGDMEFYMDGKDGFIKMVDESLTVDH